MAAALFRTSRCQDGFPCATDRNLSTHRGQSVGGHDDHVVAEISDLQSRGLRDDERRLYPHRIWVGEELDTSRRMAESFGPQPSWVHGLVNAVAVLIIARPCPAVRRQR